MASLIRVVFILPGKTHLSKYAVGRRRFHTFKQIKQICMPGYPATRIATIIGGHFIRQSAQDAVIENLITDSRQYFFPAKSLFFALPGKNRDGHSYIPELYANGVRNFVIRQGLTPPDLEDVNIIAVPDVLQALQTIAAFHRSHFAFPVIGITGSNGKTIVKEWLAQLLHADFNIVRSPKSFNSQIGVPLSIWQIGPEHNLGIFEAGISEAGEMQKLAPIIRCNVGLLTKMGAAHSEGFPDLLSKTREKLKLFDDADILIYCRDKAAVEQAVLEDPARKVFSWSALSAADLAIISAKQHQQQTLISAVYKDKEIRIRIPFTDQASIENAIYCWCLMLYMGYDPALIASRMIHLEPIAMRLEFREGINLCTLINDSYNSDLSSLAIALNFLEHNSGRKRRSMIISDIYQSGLPAEVLYQKVANLIAAKSVQKILAVGSEIRALKQYLPEHIESGFFDSTQELLQQYPDNNFQNEAILIKGSRAFGFERIAEKLALRIHRTVLQIDMNALANNLKVYRSLLAPQVKMMIVVKASAYGSGSFEVTRFLELQKTDYLAVAYADEGIELRKAGIQLPILVMNPDETSFQALFTWKLEPEIYSFSLLQAFLQRLPDGDQSFNIHLKVDTGMHRLGFNPDEAGAVVSLLKLDPRIRVATVFSHLAASDEEAHAAFTHEQAARFDRFYEALTAEIGYRPDRHLLNSGGISHYPQYQYEMIRLGIGLYGEDNHPLTRQRLQPVHTLTAVISQIKDIQAGESVGYSRAYVAREQKRIGTISIGYADGLFRSAGNGRCQVWLHGRRAPIIGNVCMDMSMIDLSDIPEAREGDEVVLFGREPRLGELARQLDTIPYEIITSISSRVKRVFFREEA